MNDLVIIICDKYPALFQRRSRLASPHSHVLPGFGYDRFDNLNRHIPIERLNRKLSSRIPEYYLRRDYRLAESFPVETTSRVAVGPILDVSGPIPFVAKLLVHS